MDIGFNLGVVVVCFSIVFLILVGLSYVIVLQRKIIEKIDGRKRVEKKIEAADKPVYMPAAETNDDEDIVAAICAAVAAVLNRPSSQIVVRSIRRAGYQSDPWTAAGRQDLMGSRY